VRSPKFIWAPVYGCTHLAETPQLPPLSTFGLIYEGAIGQPRQTTHLFATPWYLFSVHTFFTIRPQNRACIYAVINDGYFCNGNKKLIMYIARGLNVFFFQIMKAIPSWSVMFAWLQEPEFVNVQGAQESIPPAYVAWRAGTTTQLIKFD
jgi:hypothetical protein